MTQWRPLLAAATVTTVAAALVVAVSGGHSPFATPVAAADQQPVAAADVGEPAAPADETGVDATNAPSPVQTADQTAPAATSPSGRAAPAPRTGSSRGAPATTPRPTANATPRPAPAATPKPQPTPEPTPRRTPAPVSDSPALSVDASGANPALSWTVCTSPSFAAYGVVRSTDSEIHYPAEDNDTVVALVTSRSATRLTDSGAPAGVRVWYAVWCLSASDGEYKTIWKTPTVAVTP